MIQDMTDAELLNWFLSTKYDPAFRPRKREEESPGRLYAVEWSVVDCEGDFVMCCEDEAEAEACARRLNIATNCEWAL